MSFGMKLRSSSRNIIWILQAVYAGKDGVFTSVQADTLLVDCSTIDPMVAKSMSNQAKEKSANFCDAPVSGGVNAAAVNEQRCHPLNCNTL